MLGVMFTSTEVSRRYCTVIYDNNLLSVNKNADTRWILECRFLDFHTTVAFDTRVYFTIYSRAIPLLAVATFKHKYCTGRLWWAPTKIEPNLVYDRGIFVSTGSAQSSQVLAACHYIIVQQPWLSTGLL